jgi:ribonuclease-3
MGLLHSSIPKQLKRHMSRDFEKLVPTDFLQSRVFREAITHRSADGENYERLEYLGDAVLDLVIAEYLFFAFPSSKEGDLSRIRSYLVREETLAEIANEIDLGKLVILGQCELKSGGQYRDTLLADALEAVIGALYVHRDINAAKQFILRLYKSRIHSLPAPDELKDPKSQLQELLQSRNIALADYRLVNVEGASHAQSFKSLCEIKALNINTTAWGSSKRKAEQASARKALAEIQCLDDSKSKDGVTKTF